MGIVIDLINNRTIYSKNPIKTAQERLAYHNETFANKDGTIHYPENAYFVEDGDVIYIKRKDWRC